MKENMEKNTKMNESEAKRQSTQDLEDTNYYDKSKHLFMASAGSGKTYRLAFEYICLLLKKDAPRDAYKHILAITFTIKATGEMKERILNNLEMLASDSPENPTSKKEIEFKKDKEEYEQHLCNRLGLTTKELRERAKSAFFNLLHDYSNFHISTIDSFFQKILKNLARELGLGSYWNVEMDQKSVLADVVQDIFDRVAEDKNLEKWITEYIRTKLDDEGKWKIKDDIQNFGELIFKEAFTANEQLQNFIKSGDENEEINTERLREKLETIRENLKEKRNDAINEMATIAKEYLALTGDNSEKLYNKDIYKHISDVAAGKDMTFKKTEMDCMNGEQGKSLTTAGKKRNMSGEDSKIREWLIQLASLQQEKDRLKHQQKHINKIGLLGDIMKTCHYMLHEKNLFMLSDTQPLLNKFTEEGDAPFIFEKIGARLQYIMIDEFQDTSKIQYKNFEPLIENCASQENGGSLIVGDPKQAIYRFRNGDWKLIKNLKDNYNTHNMKISYRSAKNIVELNNMVFSKEYANSVVVQLSEKLGELGNESANSDFIEYINAIYDEGDQFAMSKEDGYVEIQFLSEEEEDDDEDKNTKALVGCVEKAKNAGVAENDMTILVRKNNEIPIIASELSRRGYNVKSNEAFQLKASARVRLIIDSLRYVSAITDKDKETENERLYKQILLSDMSRYKEESAWTDNIGRHVQKVDELCKKMKNEYRNLPLYDLVETMSGELFDDKKTDAYMQSLFDHIRKHVARKPMDLPGMLKLWDEKLSTTTIPIDETAKDGIKIMSIHKSKGLEAHTIILASCNWTTTVETSLGNTLWCHNEGEGELPFVPIKYSSSMKESNKDDFNEETAQLYIDNLNILYVAMTRAKNNLFVLSNLKDSDTVGELLYNCLSKDIDTEKNAFVKGTIVKSKEEHEDKRGKDDVIVIEGQDIYDNMAKFKQSSKAKNFIIENYSHDEMVQKRMESADKGTLFHSLFEQIDKIKDMDNKQADIEKAVEILIHKGLVKMKDKENILEQACAYMDNLDDEHMQAWFSKNSRTYNESRILTLSDKKKNQRPDRVVESNGVIYVIDYKTGEKSGSHKTQVRDYMKLVEKIKPGKEVKGFIWYMKEKKGNNVVQV